MLTREQTIKVIMDMDVSNFEKVAKFVEAIDSNENSYITPDRKNVSDALNLLNEKYSSTFERLAK